MGPKLAQRVVMELKDKAPTVMAMGGALTVDAAPGDEVIEAPRPAAAPKANFTAEALSALRSTGDESADLAAAMI